MRIERLKIHNYRSIRDLEMECFPFVTLLGPNNHGKSNLLSSLEFFFSTSAKPVDQDFFLYREKGDNDFWVEITFHELTEQEKNTFKKYVQSDGTICVRKTARIQNGIIESFYNGYVEQPDVEWLNSDNAGDYTSREVVNQTPLKDLIPPSGRVTKANIEEAQQQYIEQHREELKFTRDLEKGPLLGQKNVGGGVLPDFYLIPAVRDLTDEIKVKTTTTFGRLLNRAVREMAERDPRFMQARKHLEEVVQSLNVRDSKEQNNNQLAVLEKSIEEELRTWGVKVNIEVTPPELERLFELGTDVHLNDGVKTTADRKGHGLQRAMMFALLRAWAKTLREERSSQNQEEPAPRKQSDSVIFALEEPELFLHPHAQRKLATTLREIAATSEHQVFICTHSTHFVDLEHYKEVAIITKDSPEKGSCVRQCVKELFEGNDTDERKKRFHMAQWINPERGEMFFAKRVVFVEGETEKVLLPYLAKKLGVFDPDISIIDCGSKHNLPLYIAIAKAFQIPYVVIHDEDPLPDPIPDDWNEDKKKASERTFELNDKIKSLVESPLGLVEMLSPDFENVSGVSKSQGEKKGKALATLDHFEAMKTLTITERLKQVVCAAFNCQGEQS
ncbi:MAG: ATP-dependent nuclease [Melioribacter sp.]|uniref:ATP-dependent nuclease n=1 Tax=Melioribacter sp. TaxID=2052167 RepID=UPI003BD60296